MKNAKWLPISISSFSPPGRFLGGHYLTPNMIFSTYKTCMNGVIECLKRVIEEIKLLDLHLFVIANTLFSKLGNVFIRDLKVNVP